MFKSFFNLFFVSSFEIIFIALSNEFWLLSMLIHVKSGKFKSFLLFRIGFCFGLFSQSSLFSQAAKAKSRVCDNKNPAFLRRKVLSALFCFEEALRRAKAESARFSKRARNSNKKTDFINERKFQTCNFRAANAKAAFRRYFVPSRQFGFRDLLRSSYARLNSPSPRGSLRGTQTRSLALQLSAPLWVERGSNSELLHNDNKRRAKKTHFRPWNNRPRINKSAQQKANINCSNLEKFALCFVVFCWSLNCDWKSERE